MCHLAEEGDAREVSGRPSDGGNNEGTVVLGDLEKGEEGGWGVNKGVNHTLIRAGRRSDDGLTTSDALASHAAADEASSLASGRG